MDDVLEGPRAPANVRDPDVDRDRLGAIDERLAVVDLVAGHDDTGLERVGQVHPLEERDPGLLEIDEVGDVVDVPVGVHVGPPQRAPIRVSSHDVSLG